MIYCDGDGVLFNFYDAYLTFMKRPDLINNYPKRNDLYVALGIEKGEMYRSFNHAGEEFWSNLELLPHATKLWEFLQQSGQQIKILTSVIRNGKAIWWREKLIKKHFGKDFKDFIISNDKALYAKPNTLLIDDREEVIGPFALAGGKVYLWAQPWNSGPEIPFNDRLKDLAEIIKTLEGK